MKHPTAVTATRLGWAGLLPFISAPIAQYWPGAQPALLGTALATYALAIVCFLAGAWWGIALLRRQPAILVASNFVVIVAWLGYLLLPTQGSLMLMAALMVGTVIVERTHHMFQPQPSYYAALRLRLGIVASFCLVLSAAQF